MYQVPTRIWNEIAQTQDVKHQPWTAIFPMDSEAMLSALNQLENLLSTQGADARTIRGFLLVAPLLMEHQAIARYLNATNNVTLSAVMPELTSIPEAVDSATSEYRLNPSQQQKLTTLLTQAYRTPLALPSSAPPTASA